MFISTLSAQSLSRIRLFATAWTVACHTPLSMEFSRPEGWSAISSRGFAIPCHFLPRDQTQVSCISCIGRLILHHCTIWEAP